MNIQDIIKSDIDQGVLPDKNDQYCLIVDGVPLWYSRKTHYLVGEVSGKEVLRDDWESYNTEEIRPENEDEVWLNSHTKMTYLYSAKCESLISARGLKLLKELMGEVIHGRDNWTRLFPSVEEPKYGKSIPTILDEQRKKVEEHKQQFIMDEMSARAAGKFPTEGDLFLYVKNLATSIWEKHYKDDSIGWKPLDTVYGMLTQIDNMVTGLQRPKEKQYFNFGAEEMIDSGSTRLGKKSAEQLDLAALAEIICKAIDDNIQFYHNDGESANREYVNRIRMVIKALKLEEEHE
ncbi:hypothetical protein KAR91_24345 [Candidatus Pacearchaeota archaeon]|nr:hypothetical protein [Candidatus Pacearchaeota archaeon]